MVSILLIPLPPRFCARKLSRLIRLIYPSFVMVMTVLVTGIKSSMEISYSSNPMDVLLSSPYLSAIRRISSRMTPSSFFLSARIAFNSVMRSINSAYSFSSFSRSRPVSARRRISTIACACTSVSEKRSIKRSFASWVFLLLRIMLITSSILSSAVNNPCKIWARSSALFRSYFVLLVTTSS